MRTLGQVGLLTLTVALLSLAFEPWGIFFLAWVALVPWLFVVLRTPNVRRVFFLSWAAGAAFFALNLAWLCAATIPGMIAASVALGLSWALVALAIRTGVKDVNRSPTRNILFIAACWCVGEWLRVTAVGGFGWLLLGHSQSRLSVVCQITDLTGVLGVSFCIAMVNACIAIALIQKTPKRDFAVNGAGPPAASSAELRRPGIRAAILTATALLTLVVVYGVFRLHQTNVLSPGPRILLVQTNVAYSHGGVPSLKREQIVDRHLALTRDALTKQSQAPELIIWSEAMMPPLNPEARTELRRSPVGPFITQTHEQIASLAASTHAGVVTGGYYVGGWKQVGPRTRTGDDRRNAAFFYDPDGAQSSDRYDKIELVPFAELLPWPGAPAWIRSTMLFLAAPNAREPDTPGDADRLTVFSLAGGRGERALHFVTPICFENVDGPFISKMLRGGDGGKRADFIANLTNDGWFSAQEHAQHLQAVVFRAIENRVPIARASNTGISAFIDSVGRVQAWLPAGEEGTLAQSIQLDRRITLYSRFPSLFPLLCVIALLAGIATKCLRRR